MKKYKDILSMKTSSKCRQRRQNRAVKEAVKCLIDNGFTNIDIASFMTADEADVCTTIANEYAALSSVKGDKPCRKAKQTNGHEKNLDMSTDKVSVTNDGYVKAKVSDSVKHSKNYGPIQYLENGLSYLNYANIGSCMGLCDPEADHRTGISFIMDALHELLDEKNMDDFNTI